MRELRTEVDPGSLIGLEMGGWGAGEAGTTGLTNHIIITFLIKKSSLFMLPKCWEFEKSELELKQNSVQPMVFM